jgi:hypothetical protein
MKPAFAAKETASRGQAQHELPDAITRLILANSEINMQGWIRADRDLGCPELEMRIAGIALPAARRTAGDVTTKRVRAPIVAPEQAASSFRRQSRHPAEIVMQAQRFHGKRRGQNDDDLQQRPRRKHFCE